ncbi:MAG: UbiD family decarboxylase, partial [Deltaproteobacteria bacterium]|nr:UbiD family decarboxylase [Deltaproteobacteria bacterium]
MPYADLREFLKKLESCGKLHRIVKPVDKDWEIAAVAKVAFESIPESRRPALMFEQVKGFDMPLVLGALGGSRAIYCLALECEIKDVHKKWGDAERQPIAPVRIANGPVQDKIFRGEQVNLLKLPIPTWTVGQDPSPYVTSGYVITNDPDTGMRNVGVYRIQLKGA